MSSYEKKSLIYFLLVYLCSSFFLLSVVVYLVYENEKESLITMAHQKMQIEAQNISKRIVETHMNGEHNIVFKTKNEFLFALLDKNDATIKADFVLPKSIQSDFFNQDGSYYLVDYGALNHMNVHKIVVKNDILNSDLNKLFNQTIVVFLILIVAICLIGFYLGKLFLKPMRLEIERFNDFIAQSAHELNTPVASLLLIADMFKNEQNSQNVARLKIIARSITGIYEDLSYFATRGIIKNSDEMLDIAEIANQRVTIFEESAKFKNIEILQNIKEFYILIDRTRAARLIDNLLSNAIKYTPNGGKICVMVNKGTLIIEDSGSGISSEFAKIAFNKYSRDTNTVSGLGLGLAIVKSICDDYNITINIEKSDFGGAKFILKWNLKQ